MPTHHKLQTSRFELKYIVDESLAASIREFVQSYLEPDEYADPGRNNSYPICSLYLDTPDLFLYRQTVVGEKNRFKLRIRFYDDNPGSPAFLEIKRRVTDVILKERAKVTRDGARCLLQGESADPLWLLGDNGDEKAGKALLNFCSLRENFGAAGAVYVSYQREAYVSADSNSLRVTFDRQLVGSLYKQGTHLSFRTDGASPEIGNGDQVILELKFTDRFPQWMRDLVQVFNLRRISVPKYVNCVEAMGLEPAPHSAAEAAARREL